MKLHKIIAVKSLKIVGIARFLPEIENYEITICLKIVDCFSEKCKKKNSNCISRFLVHPQRGPVSKALLMMRCHAESF
jgi:hypothetical protein